METKDKLKEISKNLQIEVDEIKENDHPMDRCSWPYQAGILISGDEAELIISALEQQIEAEGKELPKLIKLVRIARKGAHYSSGNSTYWKFDVDREQSVVDEYLNKEK